MKKYHPCSKEFQEEAKKLGLTGYQYIQKLREEGKLPNPTNINRKEFEKTIKIYNCNSTRAYIDHLAKRNGCASVKEYRDILAKRKEFDNFNEYKRNIPSYKKIYTPMSESKNSTYYLGVYIGERKIARFVLPIILGNIKKEMPSDNPGFDFILEKDIKVDIKSSCLKDGNRKWQFKIDYNSIADYFMLIAIDNRTDINIMHIWLIEKNDIVRNEKFYNRFSIVMTNLHKYLLELKRYDHIDKLKMMKEWKEFNNDIRNNI